MNGDDPDLEAFKTRIEFEILNAAETMNGDDPDLEAFESNLGAIIRVRELGKTAGMQQHQRPIFAQTRQTLNRWQFQANNAQLDSLCSTSSHRQSDSDDSPDYLENSAEVKFKGHLYFAVCRWSAEETYKDAVLAAVEEQYLPTVPVPVHHMDLF